MFYTDNENRARQVAFLLRWGLTNKQIGRVLGITEGTVKVHIKRLTWQTRTNNRAQLAVLACREWGLDHDLSEPPRTREDVVKQLNGGA